MIALLLIYVKTETEMENLRNCYIQYLKIVKEGTGSYKKYQNWPWAGYLEFSEIQSYHGGLVPMLLTNHRNLMKMMKFRLRNAAPSTQKKKHKTFQIIQNIIFFAEEFSLNFFYLDFSANFLIF